MDINQPWRDNRLRYGLAVLSIALGMLLSAVHLFGYFRSVPPSWKVDEALALGAFDGSLNTQPKTDDWPLVYLKRLFTTHSNAGVGEYTVRLVPVHGTDLLEFTVEGQSKDHTQIFAAWIMNSFARSIGPSYYPHDVFSRHEPKAPLFVPPEPPKAVCIQWLTLCLSLMASLFLLTSGVYLLRVSECPGHNAEQQL